jgi:hypothetical protein
MLYLLFQLLATVQQWQAGALKIERGKTDFCLPFGASFFHLPYFFRVLSG